MPYILLQQVEREITRLFAPEHVGYVRTRLSERSLPLEHSAPPPRVHLAVLWLSQGDLERFDRELDSACVDWRDTLVAAGLANANWRSLLMARGIDCQDW